MADAFRKAAWVDPTLDAIIVAQLLCAALHPQSSAWWACYCISLPPILLEAIGCSQLAQDACTR